MAIQRLQKDTNKTPELHQNSVIDSFIDGGGKVKEEVIQSDEIRVTLRMPTELAALLDAYRKQRPGFLSRNSAIVELLHEALKQRQR